MKRTYIVKLILSDKQVQVIAEMNGIDAADLIQMSNEFDTDVNEPRIITDHPNFDIGFGADLNDVLGLGFLTLNHLQEGNETKVDVADCTLHPYRVKIPVIESVQVSYLEVPEED